MPDQSVYVHRRWWARAREHGSILPACLHLTGKQQASSVLSVDLVAVNLASRQRPALVREHLLASDGARYIDTVEPLGVREGLHDICNEGGMSAEL